MAETSGAVLELALIKDKILKISSKIFIIRACYSKLVEREGMNLTESRKSYVEGYREEGEGRNVIITIQSQKLINK